MVYILGSYDSGNVGDDAILYGFLQYLTENNYNSQVSLMGRRGYIKKTISELKLNVKIASGLTANLVEFIKNKDVCICGGDYLDDYGSLRYRLLTYFKFLFVIIITRLFGKSFYFYNTGIRVNSNLGNFFTRVLLTLMNGLSIRDHSSWEQIEKINPGFAKLGFDTAALLNYPFYNELQQHVIGISVTPYKKNFFHNFSGDYTFVKELSDALFTFLTTKNNVCLKFFIFNNSPEDGDYYLTKSIINNLSRFNDRIKSYQYDGDITLFLREMSKTDRFVCCKYHSIIFAYMIGIPSIIFNYHPKNKALIRDICSDKQLVKMEPLNLVNPLLCDLLENPINYLYTSSIYMAKRKAYFGINSISFE